MITHPIAPNHLQEVRLYATLAAVHTLRLHAPENPYTDPQLLVIFRQLIAIFRTLEDPAAPHYRVALSLLDTAATVKILLLLLDLDSAGPLVLDLFNTLLEAINAENKDQIEGPVVSILSSLIEEGDDVDQPLLDSILGRLLPSAHEENPQAYHLASIIIRRTQSTLQPVIQRFMTKVLEGQRTNSELISSSNSSDLVLQMCKVTPQMMLPVLPHLLPGLQVESEERRLDAVEVVCQLLTRPGAHAIMEDYPALPEGILRRLNDRSPEVRLRVLSHTKALADAFSTIGTAPSATGGVNGTTDGGNDVTTTTNASAPATTTTSRGKTQRDVLMKDVATRLQDPDERVRSAAAVALCSIAAEYPSALHTQEMHALVGRLRDKRLTVRKEVAAQVARLVRAWTIRFDVSATTAPTATNDTSHPPLNHPSQQRKDVLIQLTLGLCGLSLTRDVDLATYVMDDLFKNGVLPSKLPPAVAATWWSEMWGFNNGKGGSVLGVLVRGKCEMQRQVQELLALREEKMKEEAEGGKAAMLLGGGGQSNDENNDDENNDDENNNGERSDGDEKKKKKKNASQRFASALSTLAATLPNINRAEEGLNKLWSTKDNHVYRGLGVLAAHGTPLTEALAAAKELQPRVGFRGPAADVLQALIARMSPTIISPEVVAAALQAAVSASPGGPQELFITQLLNVCPQLFARQLPLLVEMLEDDDVFAGELAARVIAAGGTWLVAGGGGGTGGDHLQDGLVSDAGMEKLRDICLHGSPGGAKCAVRAIVHLQGIEKATATLRPICTTLLQSLRSDAALLSKHSRILAALKAIGAAMRSIPALLIELCSDLFDVVTHSVLPTDLSSGKPLSAVDGIERKSKVGKKWGSPSPDVEIKAAAIKALAQALVPDDPAAARQMNTATATADDGGDSNPVPQIVGALVSTLGELTDVDVGAEVFSSMRWRLLQVKWKMGVEDEDDNDEYDVVVDGSELDEDQRTAFEMETRNASPDAGCIRLAAATALFRLSRGYDPLMTGNDYMTLGLACQDILGEVRRALMDKITATVAYFERADVTMPQRASRTAALYALYSCEHERHVVKTAFTRLADYVAARRTAVQQHAMVAAVAGDSGTMINEMPEFILPFLIYFMANHPDYDSSLLTHQQEVQSYGQHRDGDGNDGERGDEEDHAVVRFVCNTLQMALETLILPPGIPSGVASTAEQRTEVARQAGASFKVLRQLKFCNSVELTAVRGTGDVDEAATLYAHQVCDIAIYIARNLLNVALDDHVKAVQKFPGHLALPKLCFRPRKDLKVEDKRRDGSDLPPSYRPALNRPLFAEEFVVAAAGAGAGAGGGRRAGGEGRGRHARKRDAGEVVDQQQQKKKTKGKKMTNGNEVVRSHKRKAKTAVVAAVMTSPVRQQPRRGAKDAAGEKLKAQNSSDSSDSSDGSEEEVAVAAVAEEKEQGGNENREQDMDADAVAEDMSTEYEVDSEDNEEEVMGLTTQKKKKKMATMAVEKIIGGVGNKSRVALPSLRGPALSDGSDVSWGEGADASGGDVAGTKETWKVAAQRIHV